MSDRRLRNDPRREATRLALIEGAERLFARHGVDGASTRQLGAEIGSANTNVVLYYFGSKEALVVEVMRHRIPAIEARRRELLEQARRRQKSLSLGVLLDILVLPFFEQVDTDGNHSYALFLSGLLRSKAIDLRTAIDADYPITSEVVALVLQAVPGRARSRAIERLQLVLEMVFMSLLMIDRQKSGAIESRRIFKQATKMAEAALLVE